MSKREQRVIKAFINCVKSGEYSFDYACLLIEDTDRYGYLTDAAKEEFYAEFEPQEEPVIVSESVEDINESTGD